ncbi:YcaO-like family protein [Desulfovibrio mangrovi]|uniref:YcaO-like family protein n=1 Tax=Desulfovibrio mangrovi TaxID=2976983 RepID=UPI002245A6B7|nr:YcaO-like family protein [Desulfovibrio mangrovi]UZP68020.1 YcaO-like family protein [Desulfovibrio mangrovi]
MPNSQIMRYSFTLTDTKGTVGYVACNPSDPISFDDALAYQEAHPYDEFMHKYLLEQTKEFDTARIEKLLDIALEDGSIVRPVLAALLLESCLLHPAHGSLLNRFPENALAELRNHTPLIYLKWWMQDDREAHKLWSAKFKSNMQDHRILPLPEDMDDFDLPMLFNKEEQPKTVSVAEMREKLAAESYGAPWQRPAPEQTAMLALERLVEYGFVADVEMRHIASLSPIALLRRWHLDIAVECGRHNLTLQGIATSYGRGLSLADTRAGYSMEMVERGSSFASIGPSSVLETARNHPIMVARLSELTAKGVTAMDPNSVPLEVPYQDEPLHWMQGHTPGAHGPEPIMVPVQMVYMFCNLDEIALFSAQGSTGLASGNIIEEAKVAALTEIIERDAEATKPFIKADCFRLVSEDEKVKMLLADYEARGVHVMLQDITTEFGIPCYKAFVMTRKGEVIRGTGAGLNGQRAVISALTETPYPYPQGPQSAPPLRDLPIRRHDELPDFSMEDPIRNLQLMERTLIANNRRPVYVELQRKDLQFPVVKAFIPGLELTADFDTFSRISQRLFANYLHQYA